MATKHKMWAVVNTDGIFCGFGYTKGDAKYDALTGRGCSWKNAKRQLGWRVVRVTVSTLEEADHD